MNTSNSWHLLDNGEVLRLLTSDMYRGLTSKEAKKRRRTARFLVYNLVYNRYTISLFRRTLYTWLYTSAPLVKYTISARPGLYSTS